MVLGENGRRPGEIVLMWELVNQSRNKWDASLQPATATNCRGRLGVHLISGERRPLGLEYVGSWGMEDD